MVEILVSFGIPIVFVFVSVFLEVVINVVKGIARDHKNIYRIWVKDNPTDPTDTLRNEDRVSIDYIKRKNNYYYIESLYAVEFNSISSSLALNIVLTSLTISIIEEYILGQTTGGQNLVVVLNCLLLVAVIGMIIFANTIISPEETKLRTRWLIGAIVTSIFTIGITIYAQLPI